MPARQVLTDSIEIKLLLTRLEQATSVLPSLTLADFATLCLRLLPEVFADKPARPTRALPGTQGKIDVMTQRAEAGEQVFAQADSLDPIDRGVLMRQLGNSTAVVGEERGLRCADADYVELPYDVTGRSMTWRPTRIGKVADGLLRLPAGEG